MAVGGLPLGALPPPPPALGLPPPPPPLATFVEPSGSAEVFAEAVSIATVSTADALALGGADAVAAVVAVEVASAVFADAVVACEVDSEVEVAAGFCVDAPALAGWLLFMNTNPATARPPRARTPMRIGTAALFFFGVGWVLPHCAWVCPGSLPVVLPIAAAALCPEAELAMSGRDARIAGGGPSIATVAGRAGTGGAGRLSPVVPTA